MVGMQWTSHLRKKETINRRGTLEVTLGGGEKKSASLGEVAFQFNWRQANLITRTDALLPTERVCVEVPPDKKTRRAPRA